MAFKNKYKILYEWCEENFFYFNGQKFMNNISLGNFISIKSIKKFWLFSKFDPFYYKVFLKSSSRKTPNRAEATSSYPAARTGNFLLLQKSICHETFRWFIFPSTLFQFQDLLQIHHEVPKVSIYNNAVKLDSSPFGFDF